MTFEEDLQERLKESCSWEEHDRIIKEFYLDKQKVKDVILNSYLTKGERDDLLKELGLDEK